MSSLYFISRSKAAPSWQTVSFDFRSWEESKFMAKAEDNDFRLPIFKYREHQMKEMSRDVVVLKFCITNLSVQMWNLICIFE